MPTAPHHADAAPVLSAALCRALDEAQAAIEPGRWSDDVAIHELRKALKRYRALLRIVQPDQHADATAARREAGALARRLAGARDLTAAMLALDDLAGRKLIRAEVADLRAAIDVRRAEGERQQLDAAARAEIGAFIGRARSAAQAEPPTTIRELVERVARHYRRMRRAAPDDWDDAPAEALHELRKAVVIHRYQMELLRPLWPRAVDLWTGETQRLRDRLGQHQDLEALARLAAELPALDARRRARLMAAVRTRQRDLRAAAARQHARLAAEKPRAFAARFARYAAGGARAALETPGKATPRPAADA